MSPHIVWLYAISHTLLNEECGEEMVLLNDESGG